MKNFEELLDQLQDELFKSMKMLIKAKNAEERKNHAQTVFFLTNSLKTYSDTVTESYDRMDDLDEELEFLGKDEDDEGILKF